MSQQLKVLRTLAAAAIVVAGAAHATALGTAQAERSPSKAAATAATAAVAAVAGIVTPGAQAVAADAQETVAGADLALLLGGLGAIGFVTMRRGRDDA